MLIRLIWVGRTTEKSWQLGIEEFRSRIERYGKFQIQELEAGRGDESSIRRQEGDMILKKIEPKDFLVLLDETGKELTSVGFAELLAHHQKISTKTLVFLIGGAYGFTEEVYKRANLKMALSKMTFPHQMVRVIFLEQLYRAHSILRREKYHH